MDTLLRTKWGGNQYIRSHGDAALNWMKSFEQKKWIYRTYEQVIYGLECTKWRNDFTEMEIVGKNRL